MPDERTCPKCGSHEIHDGYGFAAGGIGAYTMCLDCGEILASVQDPEYDPPK